MVGHYSEGGSGHAMFLGKDGIEREEIDTVLDAVENDAAVLAPEIDVLWNSFPVVSVFHSDLGSWVQGKERLTDSFRGKGGYFRKIYESICSAVSEFEELLELTCLAIRRLMFRPLSKTEGVKAVLLWLPSSYTLECLRRTDTLRGRNG